MPSLRSIPASTSTLRNAAILAGALASALVLSGCGIGAPDATTAPAVNVAFAGVVHGGPNPVVGATVKLYATGSANPGSTPDGYGVGQLLAEADSQGPGLGDTDANGDFSFSTATYVCPAKQFAYIVASGGNPGAGTNNTAVLVAALGRCEDLTSSTSISISELSTIAAAYALGHFTTITGSVAGGDLNVGIGAPDTENSQTYTVGGLSAGCVSNSFYTVAACPTTATAGLYHAFLNALNLMATTGPYQHNANTALPNPGTTVDPPIPPFALLNTLGNVLVSCVNSTGALTNGTSNTACGDLFAATTPPGGAAPTNTFQAMINLAANPTLAGTTNPATSAPYTPAEILALASPVNLAYAPSLTGTPNDFSMAIYYPDCLGTNYTGGCGGTPPASNPFQGLTYPYSHATDINDILYIANMTTSGSSSSNIISISSNGSLLGYTPDNDSATAYKHAFGASVDALGNIYAASDASEITEYSSANGVLTTDADFAGASGYNGNTLRTTVDRANDVWYISASSMGPNVYEITPGATRGVLVMTVGTASAGGGASGGANTAAEPEGISIDPDQNIWIGDSASGVPGQVTIIPNTGAVTAPTYNFTGSGSGQPFTVSLSASAEGTYGIAIGGPSSTNWSAYALTETPTFSGVTPLTPTLSGATVTAATPGTFFPDTNNGTSDELWYGVVDGDGNVYAADEDGHGIAVLPYGGTALEYLDPCASNATTSTSCATLNTVSRDAAVDSTGSVWLANPGNKAEYQLIGAAAPTWPLLSLGVPGRP